MFSIFLIFIFYVPCIFSTSCIVNDDDFTDIELHSPWKAVSDDRNTTYMIRLCDGLKTTDGTHDCHSNTRICMTRKNDPKFPKPMSTGNKTDTGKPHNGKHNDTGEVWFLAAGDTCPDDPTENLTSIINFKCGKTMGSPEFIEYSGCTSFFEWRTVALCKPILQTAVKEVPCYVYDENNEKYDLTPLIKSTSGYLVDSTEGWQFYINVCRDITAGDKTSKCPKGASACRIHGNDVYNVGKPKEKLRRNVNGNLELQYFNNETVLGCTVPPTTTIEFRCPKQGGSKDPVLTHDLNCQYNILWYTEHACGESIITSNTCRITQEDRDIDINLSPLTHDPASNHPYEANAPPKTQYWLNVCGDIGIQCPDEDHVKGVVGCQTVFGTTEAHVIGKTDKQLLRYADGDLTLTYRGGEVCGHSKFHRTMVINFACNETADHNGKGWPVFDYEYECTYYFKWQTKYACLNHPVDSECRVNVDGKRFDLSPLVKHTGQNWEVLDVDQHNKKNRYFINICNDLLIAGDAARCHPDASVCLIDDQGTVHNLGTYSSNPVYNNASGSDLLQITFSHGDSCKEGADKKKTVVTFICKPGDLESGPIFVESTLDECTYEFEWYTAAACILGHSEGDNCRVTDEQAGINFDLSKLTKPEGQFYNISYGEYNYLMNVCGKVKHTPCGTNPDPGVCQISTKINGQSYNTGQASSRLHYYDGMINLTYTGGDPYHSTPPHNRTSSIAFLCDRDAGVGHPEFVKEDNGYNFNWMTSYACPKPPIECTVTDPKTNQQYDLSSLSKTADQGNWEVLDDHNPDHKTRYYINVCRPVNDVGVGKGCATFAAVCQSKFDANGHETIDDAYSNLGEVQSGPQIDDGNHRLYLRYRTTSRLCTDDTGKKVPFQTNVYFVCTKGALNKGPGRPNSVSKCETTIIWETEAACPLAVAESNSCTVQDPNSDFTFDLSPLMKKGDMDYYSVAAVIGGSLIKKYRLNICGSISATNCGKVSNAASAMCEEVGVDKTGIAGINNYKLYFSDDGQLTLVYYGERDKVTGRVTEVIILFQCNEKIEYGVPIYEKMDEEKYYFKFQTALACRPKMVDCVAEDSSGHQYDLTNLARIHGVMVPDPRPAHSDLTYYINVCRPVNAVPGTTCPGGPVGGCQAAKNGVAFNMGYIQSKPVVISDGTIMLRYRNGDVCHKGKPNQANRSTKITFMCSEVEHDPVFEGETDECEYIFFWRTPRACVQQPLLVGQDCKVADRLYGYEFDLNVLKGSTDYTVATTNYTYYLNLCQGLKSTSTGCGSGVAVCQTKPLDKNFHKDAGHVNASLVYDEGEITLTYSEGEPCHDAKYKRKTIITFSCDQSVSGTSGPQFVEETAECIYQFVWPTKYACPPFTTGDCRVTDSVSGKQFDLAPLAMTDDNYEYIDNVSKKKYIFNVCRSLVHQKGQTCPFNSAACQIDLATANSTNKYHNLGEVNAAQVQVDSGKVELYYNNGDLCEDGKTKVSTRIIFYCSQSVKDSHPAGHFRVGCEHHFVWSTEVGCPETETVGNNCTVTNPVTGHVFNFMGLSKKTFTVDDKRGHTFSLSVCKPLTSSVCGTSSSGACQKESSGQKRSWNAGNANSQLNFNDGVLMLNYTGGESCHQNKFHRNTVINFICSKNSGEGTPAFVDESDDCTYIIYWKTELACEEQILCTVDTGDDKELDLSPLIKSSGHHLVLPSSSEVLGETFYINVCEPLNPIYDVTCPPGASACAVKDGRDPVSLGKLKSRPFKDNTTGKITLEYEQGSKCPSDSRKNASSRIVFNCKPGAEQGEPVLESVSADCVYNFVWDTNVVCEESDYEVSLKDCIYKDESGLTIDFSPLKTNGPVQVDNTVNGKSVKYLISICDKVKTTTSGCDGTSICKVEDNKGFRYGSVAKGKFTKSDGKLEMTFPEGDTCGGSMKSTGIILFSCDPDVVTEEPEIAYTDPCAVSFVWRTRLVCPKVADTCSLTYGGHIYDLSILSSKTSSWQVKDNAGNRYWLNICEGVHSTLQSETCPDTAAACRKTPSGNIDTLGLISTQNLKMDADGKTLILEYSHGNPACSHTKRRSNNQNAKIVIKFQCGQTVGGPVFVPGSQTDSCIFEFKWTSSVACKLERQEVEVKNNKTITDPRSGALIDLSKLDYKSYSLTNGKFTFYIDTNGHATGCTNAVVCKHLPNVPGQNIGLANSKKFYIEDDVLQVEYASKEECEYDSTKTAKSVIQFHCNTQESKPMFLSESRDCTYLFIWENPYTCLTPNVVIPQPSPDSPGTSNNAAQAGNSSKGSSKIGIIVAVFSVAIIACILLIIFHKAERRSAFRARVASIICRGGRERSLYTALPSADNAGENEDDDDEVVLLASEEQLTYTAESASGQNNVESADTDVKILNPFEDSTGGYHDDSDEDLLA